MDAVGCGTFFSGLISTFMFAISRIPSGCIKIFYWFSPHLLHFFLHVYLWLRKKRQKTLERIFAALVSVVVLYFLDKVKIGGQ